MSITNNYRELFFQLCKWNYLDDVQKIYDKKRYMNEIPIIYREEIFQTACSNGHLPLAQWLLKIEPDMDVLKYNECCFRWSCSNGHLKMAQWLYSIYSTTTITDELFYSTCSHGHVEVAKWLLKMQPSIDVYGNGGHFICACGEGKMPMVKWLCSNFTPNDKTMLDAFEWACERGDIEMADYLWSISTHPLPITDELFSIICEIGKLQMVQWLYSKHPGINISWENESAFRNACCNSLEIAKWLLEIKPDIQITANNHEAFRTACVLRSQEMATWLVTLCSHYKIIKINRMGHIYYRIMFPLSNRIYTCESPAMQCPICYEKECDVRTECNHSYCMDCMDKWRKPCPMCREPIQQLHRITYVTTTTTTP